MSVVVTSEIVMPEMMVETIGSKMMVSEVTVSSEAVVCGTAVFEVTMLLMPDVAVVCAMTVMPLIPGMCKTYRRNHEQCN